MPGYRLATQDKERVTEKYLCTYCKLLLRDAMQSSCGHFYCNSCLGNLFQNRQSTMTCLKDQQPLNSREVYPDNFMRREVLALIVHCLFTEDGCKWKGEVRHLENHTSSCEFLKVPCVHPECGMMVRRADLADHLEKECMCRLANCGYCKRPVKLNMMKQHEKECPAYPVVCGKCNNEGIPRAKLSEHQSPVLGDCAEGIQAPCPFSEIGCTKTEVLTQEQRKEHLEQANTSHTTLILQLAVRMSREVESLLIRDPGVLSRSPQLFSNHDSVISDLLGQVQNVAEETRNLHQKCREQSERILSLERKVASGNTSGSPASGPQSVDTEVQTGAEGGRSLTSNSPDVRGQQSFNRGVILRNRELTRGLTNLEDRTADNQVLMQEDVETLTQQQRLLEETVGTQQQQLVENERSRDRTAGQKETNREVATLKRQHEVTQDTIRRQERRLESIEHTLALRNVSLTDLEEYTRQQEVSCYDGLLQWEISDYARRRNDAVTGRQTSLYSPCFYTSRYGYKMCARIYLNGDGTGKGTHISVFFVVMRGQYDGKLRWPFRQKVTIMLLDQDNVEHLIDAFRPDLNSSSFQKPRREMNVASGCPLFCPLSELSNHAYVRDDTMIFKIIVDTSDL